MLFICKNNSSSWRCAITIKYHDDVIKWTYFPRRCPFGRGIHWSLVNSRHKGQWRRPLMFSLICTWTNDWINNRDAGDLRRHRAHYDVIVMIHHVTRYDAKWCQNSGISLADRVPFHSRISHLDLVVPWFLPASVRTTDELSHKRIYLYTIRKTCHTQEHYQILSMEQW